MRERNLASGQEVWITGRRAIFLGLHASGAAIVRFEGERQTRVVPMRKLPGDRPARLARGPILQASDRDEPPAAA